MSSCAPTHFRLQRISGPIARQLRRPATGKQSSPTGTDTHLYGALAPTVPRYGGRPSKKPCSGAVEAVAADEGVVRSKFDHGRVSWRKDRRGACLPAFSCSVTKYLTSDARVSTVLATVGGGSRNVWALRVEGCQRERMWRDSRDFEGRPSAHGGHRFGLTTLAGCSSSTVALRHRRRVRAPRMRRRTSAGCGALVARRRRRASSMTGPTGVRSWTSSRPNTASECRLGESGTSSQDELERGRWAQGSGPGSQHAGHRAVTRSRRPRMVCWPRTRWQPGATFLTPRRTVRGVGSATTAAMWQ